MPLHSAGVLFDFKLREGSFEALSSVDLFLCCRYWTMLRCSSLAELSSSSSSTPGKSRLGSIWLIPGNSGLGTTTANTSGRHVNHVSQCSEWRILLRERWLAPQLSQFIQIGRMVQLHKYKILPLKFSLRPSADFWTSSNIVYISDLRIKADNLGRLYRDFVSRARLLLLLTEKTQRRKLQNMFQRTHGSSGQIKLPKKELVYKFCRRRSSRIFNIFSWKENCYVSRAPVIV